MTNHFAAFEALDESTKTAIKARRWQATRPVSAWLATFQTVAALDADVDVEVARLKKLVMPLVGAACVSLILAIATMGWGLILTAALSIAAIVRHLQVKRVQAIDVPNDLRGFIAPLVRCLAEDMDPQSPLTLDIDLASSRPEYAVGRPETLPVPPLSMFGAGIKKIVQRRFRKPRLSLRGTLLDGTTIVVDVVDLERVRNITKRTTRGKIKLKTKKKGRRLTAVQLHIPQKRYVADTADVKKQGDKRTTIVARHVEELMDPNAWGITPEVEASRHQTQFRASLNTIAGLYARATPRKA